MSPPFRRVIASFEFYSGAVLLVIVCYSLSRTSLSMSSALAAFVGIAVALLGILAAVWLWRDADLGFQLSIAFQLLCVPALVTSHVAFTINPGLAVWVGLASEFRLLFNASFGWVGIDVAFGHVDGAARHYAANVVALVLMGFLIDADDKRKSSRTRPSLAIGGSTPD